MHLSVDAFVSYSHAADARLAPELERGLERLARPWNRLRAVSVFRDQTDLSLTPHLWPTIRDALDAAGWFVLLASPASAASEYVGREITHFCDTKGADRVLLVLTDGELAWDDATGDFTAGSTAAHPALRGRFAEEPLWLDLRWARTASEVSLAVPRFRSAVAQVAGRIRGVPPDEIEGEDVRLRRRARRLARSAVAALAVLAVAASTTAVVAVRSERRADAQAQAAVARQVGLAALDLPSADLDRAFLLALAAAGLDPAGPDRFAPVRVLVGRSSRLQRLLHLPPDAGAAVGLRGVALAADGVVGTAVRADGSVVLVRWPAEGAPSVTAVPPGADPTALVPLPDGSVLVGAPGTGAVRVGGGTPGGSAALPGPVLAVRPDASRVLVLDGDAAVVLDPVSGEAVGRPVSAAATGTAVATSGDRAAVLAAGALSVVDLRTGRVEASGPVAAQDVSALALAPPGSATTVAAVADGRLLRWRADAGAGGSRDGADAGWAALPAGDVPAATGPVRALAAGPDGSAALVVGAAGTALLVADGARPVVRALDRTPPGAVAVDPSGLRAAVGGRSLSVWDLGTGTRSLAAPSPVAALTWSPACASGGTGCRLVTAGETLDVWEPATGRRVMLADQTNAQAVAVSADGATVVSTGWGRTAAVWAVRAAGVPGEDLAAAGPVVVDPASGRVAAVQGPPGRRVLARDGTRVVDPAARPVAVTGTADGRAVPVDPRCTGDLAAVSPRGLLVAVHDGARGVTTVCTTDTGARLAVARLDRGMQPVTALAVEDDGSVVLGGNGLVARFPRGGSSWVRGDAVRVGLGTSVVVESLAARAGVVAAGLRTPVPDGAAPVPAQVLVRDVVRGGTPVQFEVDRPAVPAVALLGDDAALVAVAAADTAGGPVTVQVWESASRRRVGRGLAGLSGDVVALGGTPSAVVGADLAGRVVRWPLDADPVREVCATVGRSLTRAEWDAAAGGALRGYPASPVCPAG